MEDEICGGNGLGDYLRIALISDIHGNYVALLKVLDDLGRECDKVVCLGDVAWGGPQPKEVLHELRRLRCPVVMGNTDEFVIGTGLDRLKGPWKEVDRWLAGVLSEKDREFVRTFQPTVRIDLGDGASLLCYHGSPRSNREEILPTTPINDIELMFKGHSERIVAGGHTHCPMVRTLQDWLLINPGSAGLPFLFKETRIPKSPPWAEYATIDYEEGKLSVSLKRAPYDVEVLEEIANQSGMPNREERVNGWK